MKKAIAVGGLLILVLVGAGVVFLGTYSSREYDRSSYPEIEVADVSATKYFSADYREARERFLESARDTGADIQSFENPHPGPDGEPIFTDVAFWGPTDAKSILVLSCGTHGVEGFAGSGIQTGLLNEGLVPRVPAGVSLLMIHAVNPYGFAHIRRVNEDNVDLNRNFRDHSEEPPSNPGYERLADAVAPRSISTWSEVASWSRILGYWAIAGLPALQEASGGQYTHPKGLFYGGTTDTWSNRTIHSIADRYLSRSDEVIAIDFHTGLGPFGNAEVIVNLPIETPPGQRAVSIWGPDRVRSTTTSGSVSSHIESSLKNGLTRALPGVEVTAVSLEFGTVPITEVIKAQRAENWLHHHGGTDHPEAREIKMRLLRAFHPDSAEWEVTVWNQGNEVVEQSLAWLRQRTGSDPYEPGEHR